MPLRTDAENIEVLRNAMCLSDEIRKELYRATDLHGPMHSSHEGYAVLKEEVDELWDDVKANASAEIMRKEAIQIAAMAMRFVLDVCDHSKPVKGLPGGIMKGDI